MKRVLLFLAITTLAFHSSAQDAKSKVERTALDYIEGFYEGDTVKLSEA